MIMIHFVTNNYTMDNSWSLVICFATRETALVSIIHTCMSSTPAYIQQAESC